MKVADRRKEIIHLLSSSPDPLSGAILAQRFGVSRQIIVGDITALKGSGFDILSTHNGYVLRSSPLKERVFKLYHTTQQTEDELNLIVGLGGSVVDVFVWHKVYGKMSAPLNIFSPLHVQRFIQGVRTGKSTELMNITGGYHYHTVRADSEAVLDAIGCALKERGYIAPEI